MTARRYSNHRRINLRLIWPGGATQVTVSTPGQARTFPVAASIPWKLAGSHPAKSRAYR